MHKKLFDRYVSPLKSAAVGILKFATVASVAASAMLSQADVLPITTSGNKVLIGGQQGSISGNSFFWSNTGWGGEKYYNASVVSWLKADWNSRLVRAAMGVDDSGGYISDTSNKTRLMAVVDAAIANDMYVIIDWHSHNAHNYKTQAIAFFQEMATKYGNKNNVIYEIYNEPLAVSWSSVIKPYAKDVIAAIRAIDPDNLIVVGTPNWSQDVDVAANDPITGYANIAYTLHFYAGSHGQSLRDKATTALNKNIPLFVTEWGSVNADGSGNVATSEADAWMAYMKTNNLSNANWSINDKAEGASALVAGASSTGGWVASQLTASGAYAKNAIWSWPTAFPYRIEAEAYNYMNGVQVSATSDVDGTNNVGYIDAGDWMSYSGTKVHIPATGTYKISFRVSSLSGGGSLQFQEAGGTTYATVAVPSTGSWNTWTTVTTNVTLSAGTHTFGIAAVAGGWNFNWFSISKI